MRTRLSVALNGVELHSIDPAICIQRIGEESPQMEASAGNRAGGDGQHLNSLTRKTDDISVQFGIDLPKRETLHRAEILQQVNAWASVGGDLSVNYRDRQKMRVRCVSLPEIDGVDRWTENYEIRFRAYETPYWQSMDRESVTATAGTAVNTTLSVRETAGGKLSISAANSSGSTVNEFAIAANNRHFAFENLGLANGETLVIDYDERDIQRIGIISSGGVFRSAIAKRTVTSNDDILLNFGLNQISMTADAAVALTAYTYGRWT